MLDQATIKIVTTPERPPITPRPPMTPGARLAGPGALLEIWITEYNANIAKNVSPRHSAARAVNKMMTTGKVSDIRQMGLYNVANSETGAPPGFSFQPGVKFPTPQGPLLEESELLYEAGAIISRINPVLGAMIELVALELALIDWLIDFFSGKPLMEDTMTVAQRFMSGGNPASWVCGALIMRNASQNGIAISSSDPGDQAILGDIRAQAMEIIIAQEPTNIAPLTPQEYAKLLVDTVWTSANQPHFVLPDYLKTDPQGGTSPGGGGGGGGGGGTPGCPPFSIPPPCLGTLPEIGQGDELGTLQQLTYYQQVMAVYLMNIYEVVQGWQPGSGSGTQADPVTCTQLTGLVTSLLEALTLIAQAISALGQGSAPGAIDWTPLIAELDKLFGLPTGLAPPTPLPPPVALPFVYTPQMFLTDAENSKEAILVLDNPQLPVTAA